MGENTVRHLLVPFVDMFGYGWEVCVELSERLHDRRSVRCILDAVRGDDCEGAEREG